MNIIDWTGDLCMTHEGSL